MWELALVNAPDLQVTAPAAGMGLDDLTCLSAATIPIQLLMFTATSSAGMQWDVNHSGSHCSLCSACSRNCSRQVRYDLPLQNQAREHHQGTAGIGRAEPVSKAQRNNTYEQLKPEM